MAKDTRTICDWCGAGREEIPSFPERPRSIPFKIKASTGSVAGLLKIEILTEAELPSPDKDICERCQNRALRDAVKRLAVPRKEKKPDDDK